MRKKFYFFAFCSLMILFAFPLSSTAQIGKKSDLSQMKAMKGNKQDARKLQMMKDSYPLFFSLKPMKVSEFSAPMRQKFGPVRSKVQVDRNGGKTILKAGNATFWGNTIYRSTWSQNFQEKGIWEYPVSNPAGSSLLFPTESNVDMAYGGGIQDGIYYGMTASIFWGMVFPYITAIDIETGEVKNEYIDDASLLATETCTDVNGTIYGMFYTSDLGGIELGIVDYEARTRTTIGSISKTYVALGITSEGVMYGVASDGNLYKIDKATAEETLVGATGLTVAGNDGAYQQSGEIDPSDNTFYWAYVSPSADDFALYTVDLSTGAATKIGDFPDNDEIVAMTMAPKLAEDGAPAKATDFTVKFVAASTLGTAKFKVPTLTYSGNPLTGSIQYKITGGTTEVTGNTTPGASVSVDISAEEGMRTFAVSLSNNVGESPRTKFSTWVGYDVPTPATDIKLEINPATGKADVSWTAPTTTLHNGYLSTLTYNVYRIENSGEPILVSSEQYGTTFSETLPTAGAMMSVSYGIVAVNGTQESQMATSNYGAVGDAFEVPYYEGFDNEASGALFTILDNDGDGKTWQWQNGRMYATYAAADAPDCDDWLISPPVKMQAGRAYEISMMIGAAASSYPEKFEVLLGNAASPEAMTISVIGETVITTGMTEFVNDNVVVPADGNYYLAVHKMSAADMYNLYVDDIRIEFGPVATAPAAVTDLTVTPGTKGAMEAKLKFTAPSKSVNGGNLTSITKVDVYRDKQLVKTVSSGLTVNTETTIVDDNIETSGVHSYYVVCHNADGNGGKSNEVSAFIGLDSPTSPANITTEDRQTSLFFKWDKVGEVGQNGGYVDPDEVIYNLMNTDGRYITDTIYSDKGNTYEFNLNTDEGEQELKTYAMSAMNSIGSSPALGIPIYVGAPYTLPMIENGANRTLNYLWYYMGSYASVVLNWSEDDADGNGYSLRLENGGEGEAWGYSDCGKISLAGTTNPVIYFSYKTDKAIASIYVIKPNGEEVLLKKLDNASEYTMAKLDLNQFKNERYIRFRFYADLEGEGSFWFDDINVLDFLDYNLVMSNVEVSNTVNMGATADVKLTVQNLGQNTAQNFTVKLYAAGEEIFSQDVASLASMEKLVLDAQYTPTIFDEAGDITLKAEVIYDLDLDLDDNTNEAVTRIVPPSYRPPRDLTVSVNEENVATMNWMAPDTSTPDAVTEGFDDADKYEDFTVGGIDEETRNGTLGNWTLYDADGYTTYAWNNVTYPNAYGYMAYQVFKPYDVFSEADAPDLAPRSGDRMLVSMCSADENNVVPTDNWLISPELPGMTQTISFFYKIITTQYGDEKFEVLYSTTDTDTQSFTKLDEVSASNVGDWLEYSVTLPEGAKYFAIRHISVDVFGLFLDDFTFIPTIASGMRMVDAPTGYNVYIDREKVTNTANTNYTTGILSNGAHLFSVSAVYNGGESMAISVTATAIEEILAEGKPVDIYTLDGVLIKKDATDTKGIKPGIYVVGDKKVFVK